MAYKYKLVTEIDPSAFQKAASAAPSTVSKINVGKKISGEQFGELENILKEKGLDDDTISDILDTWAERYMFVNPNEGKEDNFMRKASNMAQNTDSDRDLGQEEYNKTKGNTYMTPEERNMTPEERREQERKEREEQGRKNLTQEVLRRLKNR